VSIWLYLAALSATDTARFRAEIAQASSATAVLQSRCATHPITAIRADSRAKALPRSIKARLGISDNQQVRYRHVRLMCGPTLYSDADNWYVPSRLTPAMNYALDTSETPFGKVIAPLNARRSIIRTRTRRHSPFLRVTAVLTSESGAPLSGVVERYQAAVLTPPLR
jgi:chorismate-pyruvate lyase